MSDYEAAKGEIDEALRLLDRGELEAAAAAAGKAAARLAGASDPTERLTGAFAGVTQAQALAFAEEPEAAAEALDAALEGVRASFATPDVASDARSLFSDALGLRAQLHLAAGEEDEARALVDQGVATLRDAIQGDDGPAILAHAQLALHRAELLADLGDALDVSEPEAAARRVIGLAQDDPGLRALASDLLADALRAREDAAGVAEARQQGLEALLETVEREAFDPELLVATAVEVAEAWFEADAPERGQEALERVEAVIQAVEDLTEDERAELLSALAVVLPFGPSGLWADPSVQPLLQRHAAAALEKQHRLGDLVGERDWQVDLNEGLLRFGDDLAFRVQILGSEAEGPGTWLWAWANTQSSFPPHVVEAANRLKALGEEQGIEALTTPEIELGEVDGHSLGMLAVGLLGADAYYRGPYVGGAAFFLIQDPDYPTGETRPERLVTVFTQLIQTFEVDHRAAWRGYVEHHGFELREEGDALIAVTPGGELAASFDDQGRLTKLSGELGA